MSQILIQTRNVAFCCMIIASAIVALGPIEKIRLILADESHRLASQLAMLQHTPPFFLLVDDQGQSSSTRAINAGYYSFTHFIPALIWIPLWPLQFMQSIRLNYPTFHRYLGTFLFTIASILIVSPFILCTHGGCFQSKSKSPYFPLNSVFQPPFFTIIFPYAALACVKSYLHATSRRYRLHRQWMLRLTAVFQGIALVRPMIAFMGVVLYKTHPQRSESQFQFEKFWVANGVCMMSAIILIEIWIWIEKVYKLDGVQVRVVRQKPKSA